jgi:hypothetical protein
MFQTTNESEGGMIVAKEETKKDLELRVERRMEIKDIASASAPPIKEHRHWTTTCPFCHKVIDMESDIEVFFSDPKK